MGLPRSPNKEPDKRISWKSVSGAPNAGTVRFEAGCRPRATRVRLMMAYEPEGAVESAGDALGVLLRARAELRCEDFEKFIETRTEETGQWRRAVDDSELVQ